MPPRFTGCRHNARHRFVATTTKPPSAVVQGDEKMAAVALPAIRTGACFALALSIFAGLPPASSLGGPTASSSSVAPASSLEESAAFSSSSAPAASSEVPTASSSSSALAVSMEVPSASSGAQPPQALSSPASSVSPMVFAGAAGAAVLVGDFELSGQAGSYHYDPTTKTLTIQGNVQIQNTDPTQATTDKIVLQGGTPALPLEVALAGVNINVAASGGCAFDMAGAAARIRLEVGTDNYLTSGAPFAGLQAPTGSTLWLLGGGRLFASAGAGGAGLGGGQGQGSGEIHIDDGSVQASGAEGGAGIGSGANGGDALITITGGSVDAIGSAGGACIGTGNAGGRCNITISGGFVIAELSTGGAGIGTGVLAAPGNTILITGGNISATGGVDSGGHGGGAGVGGGAANTGDSSGFCGSIALRGKAVLQAIGRLGGAGIGNGKNGASWEIEISGGYIITSGSGALGGNDSAGVSGRFTTTGPGGAAGNACLLADSISDQSYRTAHPGSNRRRYKRAGIPQPQPGVQRHASHRMQLIHSIGQYFNHRARLQIDRSSR